MITISERLRARQEPVGDGSGKWRKDGLCQEAADTIDALVAAFEEVLSVMPPHPTLPLTCQIQEIARAALAKAKGKQG